MTFACDRSTLGPVHCRRRLGDDTPLPAVVDVRMYHFLGTVPKVGRIVTKVGRIGRLALREPASDLIGLGLDNWRPHVAASHKHDFGFFPQVRK